MAEYESDELASDSEDEKRLKKATETASRKRRQKDQLTSERGKKARATVGADNKSIISFFVVKKIACNLLCDFRWFWIRLSILPYFLTDLFIMGI